MKSILTFILIFNLLLTPYAPGISVSELIKSAFQSSGSSLPSSDAGVSTTDGFEAGSYSYDDLVKLPAEPEFANAFLPAGNKWLEYVGNEQPATFSKEKIRCILADGVIKAGNISQNLADLGQIMSGGVTQKLSPGRIAEKGGYISKEILDSAAGQEIKDNTVIVDEVSGMAFKVSSQTVYSGVFDSDPELNMLVKPLEGTYSVTRPELHEIVKDFELMEDTVQLNRANITGFAPNVEKTVKLLSADPIAVGDEDKKFKYLTGDNLIEMDFKDATVLQGTVGDSSIYVELSGGIAIDAIQMTGRYSCSSGYEISMTLKQECYLVATLDAEVHEEIRVPILGIDIPFVIGSVYGGIFAIIGMDGTIRLDIEARETSACKMGIKGGTFLYVPTSFHPIFEPEPPKISGDCGLNGEINGFIKFGPMLGLSLFGFDLVGAGVLLGAGVNVESDGAMMDVELYGCIDVYVALAGKHFNLVRARPAIYKKQQPDMHGYRVSFLETYINPGRVGGLIEEEPTAPGEPYLPSKDLEYRVWIIPKSRISSFDVSKREILLSADSADIGKPLENKVRTYPESGFTKTNYEGEFYQDDKRICYDGDQVWLEFIGKSTDKNGNPVNQTFFVGPAKPILPFTDISITYTDFFNDYIIGKVEPKRLIIWDANRLDPDEIQTELTYYQGQVVISPFNDYGMETLTKHLPYTISGSARTETNDKGEFDTRNPYRDENNMPHTSGVIDVLEQTDSQYVYYENGVKKYSAVYPPAWVGIVASLTVNNAVKNSVFYGIKPGMPDFQITRTSDYVVDSRKTLIEGGLLINQMEYDEYVWITNPDGTRTVTSEMLEYAVKGFSVQDYSVNDNDSNSADNVVKTIRQGSTVLTPVLDDDGNHTGTALYAQRVTLQWVWQAHPNPIRIISDNNVQVQAGNESTFQVKAEGFFPRYSLEGAPQRVWIDEESGVMYIPQTISPGEYTFTIHVNEGFVFTTIIGADPKKGNDASPPGQQTFKLIVTDDPAAVTDPVITDNTGTMDNPDSSSPAAASVLSSTAANTSTAGSQPTEKPGQDDLTAPVIIDDEYNTYLSADGSKDLVLTFKALGSTPLAWSVVSADGGSAPAGISINSSTGVLSVKASMAPGTYIFAVKVQNAAGSDLHECTLAVKAPMTQPVLESRRDGYQFTMSVADTDYTVQIKANGSQPILYTLEAVNDRIPVPTEVTIDGSSGMLHVKSGLTAGIKAGYYEFVIRASNAAGSDSRSCRLEVKPLLMFEKTGQISLTNAGLKFIPLAVSVSSDKNINIKPQTVAPGLFAGQTPPNRILIKCDDLKDVYTHDRNIYNGAYFIHWDTNVKINLAKVLDVSYSKGSNLDGQALAEISQIIDINDNTPVCDRYHYHDSELTVPLISQEELEKIKEDMKKVVNVEIAAYKNGYATVREISKSSISGRYFDFRVNPMDIMTSGLEYGTLLSEIDIKKDGIFNVDLDNDTGTVISGEIFKALAANPDASVSFKQEGAEIFFAGKDIKSADAKELINIGFTYAPHEKAIIDDIGSGHKSFTYGFQHHGKIPGTATFAISTAFSAGEKVNVYKYEADAGKYLLIAKGAIAGNDGIVTYKNNTMSEYVITTKTIGDADISDMIGVFDPSRKMTWIIVAVILAVVIAIAGAVVMVAYRKKAGKGIKMK